MIKTLKYCNSIVFMVLLLVTIGGYAQKPIGDKKPEVKVIATATKNSVLLRWGVTTPTAWKYANEYGFTIERKTITRAGKILPIPEVKILLSEPLKPKPMMQWESFTEESVNAAVAAQAIYGDDFEINMEQGGNDIVSIINKASVLEQRFGFALFAADQDFEVAKFSGLGYVDTSVVNDEQYLYTVKAVIPSEKLEIKPGGVYIGLIDFQSLPKPLDFAAVFNDKSVMLSWNYKLQKKQYNNYIVERSEDGGITFKRLDDIPVTNLSERKVNPSDRMFYVDSLPKNNKEYYYRVKGISPFGIVGPASDTAKGIGAKSLVNNPAISAAKVSKDESTVDIIWEFPEEGLSSLSHFELNRSNKVKGGYQLLTPNINKLKRSLKVSNLEGINYFTITAVGLNGAKRVSFPKMVQLKDNLPPAIPTELKGIVDSTGIVQLQWKKNLEPDFLGYRVFRANLEDEEFTQITFEPTPNNGFTDNVKIKTLNSKVYYKIRAYDKRYNPSEFSEVLVLKKPDIIPPTQPVFKSFKTESNKVLLQWITSSSEDAAKTLVYKKEKGKEAMWELVGDIPITEHSFEDTSVSSNTVYLYTLITMDESGLESKPITPLTISMPKSKTPEIDRLNAIVNRENRTILVNWKYNQNNVEEYSLYKAAENEKLTLYKVFNGDVNKFVDTKLKVNTTYDYGLRALLSDGRKSKIKLIRVEY